MNIVALTDSLGESSGGLAHATYNLATSVSRHLPYDNLSILCHKDVDEIDLTQSSQSSTLRIIKQPCFRNPIYPVSFGLGSHLNFLDPDILHLRGLWRQGSTVALRWKNQNMHKKLVVQPAGMLEPWARKRNQFSKQLFLFISESRLLSLCDYVHATSDAEASNLIRNGIPPGKIFVIQEGIHLPPLASAAPFRDPSQNSKLTLLFLSRLHPKKGIELLLDSLALLRPSNWHCRIAGMGDPYYISSLVKKAERLNLNDYVSFSGPLFGSDKDNAFSSSNAFILPSYSENFGIAVAEAMSWQLPVITTTQTPWNALSDPSLGWYVSPNLHEVSTAMHSLFSKSADELSAMGVNCRSYVSNNFSWDSIGLRMSKMYQEIL